MSMTIAQRRRLLCWQNKHWHATLYLQLKHQKEPLGPLGAGSANGVGVAPTVERITKTALIILITNQILPNSFY